MYLLEESNTKIPDSINKIFTKQICISSPDKQEVYQFILFNLFINIAPPQFIHKSSDLKNSHSN